MLAKAQRAERLARELGLLLMLPEPTLMAATGGAFLAKCDLTSLMVGEFPELQGEMGRSYALAQGVDAATADVIRDHYMPKGAADATPPTDAAALVSMADRLDTLVGCFAGGLTPTGAADPYGLRRACIGVLRCLLDRGLALRLSDAFRAAYDGFAGFRRQAGRGEEPNEAVKPTSPRRTPRRSSANSSRRLIRAWLARRRPPGRRGGRGHRRGKQTDARGAPAAQAIRRLEAGNAAARWREVFKRAPTSTSEAPPGSRSAARRGRARQRDGAPRRVRHPAREAGRLVEAPTSARRSRDRAFRAAALAVLLDVFVIRQGHGSVRENRLRQMRAISERAGSGQAGELLPCRSPNSEELPSSRRAPPGTETRADPLAAEVSHASDSGTVSPR